MTAGRIVIATAVAALLGFESASAQVLIARRPSPSSGSIELSGGVMWLPGFETVSETAELTRSGNQAPYDLFTADGEVGNFPGLYARLGYFISRSISIEGGVRFSKPELSYSLAGDAESAPDETAVETISHYLFDGSVVYHLWGASFSRGQGVPFIAGGGGYIRELHEGNELVETGSEIHVTGGVKYWFGAGRQRFGLRAEGGLSSREGGFDPGDGRRTQLIVLGGVTMLF